MKSRKKLNPIKNRFWYNAFYLAIWGAVIAALLSVINACSDSPSPTPTGSVTFAPPTNSPTPDPKQQKYNEAIGRGKIESANQKENMNKDKSGLIPAK